MRGDIMAKLEFRFVVSDVELTPEHQERISQAVAQAGALALAEVTPADAVTIRVGHNIWWRGIPAEDLREALQSFAHQQVAEGGGA